jgi:hypothetical protein
MIFNRFEHWGELEDELFCPICREEMNLEFHCCFWCGSPFLTRIYGRWRYRTTKFLCFARTKKLYFQEECNE